MDVTREGRTPLRCWAVERVVATCGEAVAKFTPRSGVSMLDLIQQSLVLYST